MTGRPDRVVEAPAASAARATLRALRRGDLAGATVLRLDGCGLAAFPPEILGLADTLEVLDLGGNALTGLPEDLGRLKRLRALFCSGNRFARLPPALGACPALTQIGCRGSGVREVPGEALPPALRWLTLTDNRIAQLPEALGARPALRKLLLAGNALRTLPAAMAGAENLELVRLAANAFEALPPWLARLPRLAWASYAGNPLEPALPETAVARVPWGALTLGALLGEGASGRVHRALWPGHEVGDDAAPRAVALKLFKGAMTSDGLPEREMAACLAAGAHPNLTGALGRLVDHPEGLEGLLMPLLPGHWRALAAPPSPESCSRDVYDPMLALAPGTALRLARSVAAAAARLHARGLLHGDLYAHNTLWDGSDGEAVLSDFGAASALPAGLERAALCAVEVRAFGLLLGELLDRCGGGLERLRGLERACTQPEATARPAMAEVLHALDAQAPDRL